MNELLAIYWPSFHDFTSPQLVGIAIGSLIGGWITAMIFTAGREFSKQEKRIWGLIVACIYFLMSFCLGSLTAHNARIDAVIDAIKEFKQGPSYYAKPEHSQELKAMAPGLTDEDCQEITSRLNAAPFGARLNATEKPTPTPTRAALH